MIATGSSRPVDLRPEQGALFDLSARTKLRISGADRLRYLNGQISNDLRKATETKAIHACVLSAKGKIDAEVFIAVEGDAFLLDTDAGMGEALSARLERYIIADDVELEEVTEAYALFHVLGAEGAALSANEKSRTAARFGEVGIDVWVERARQERVWAELSRALPVLDEADAETFRIERGLPRWGRELTGEIIPTEANLEAGAIDYAKGCYIGQEVISRIKMSGQTNKRLCGLRAEGSRVLRAGLRLVTTDEQKDVGWITSSVASPRFGRIALGFLKRGYQTNGLQLLARAEASVQAEEPIAVTVVPLPFA